VAEIYSFVEQAKTAVLMSSTFLHQDLRHPGFLCNIYPRSQDRSHMAPNPIFSTSGKRTLFLRPRIIFGARDLGSISDLPTKSDARGPGQFTLPGEDC